MIAFICDWCGATYTDYACCDQGTTLASVPKIKKPKQKTDTQDVEIPLGTKVVTVGWTTPRGTLISTNSKHVCKECYEAYTEFVKSRKKEEKEDR